MSHRQRISVLAKVSLIAFPSYSDISENASMASALQPKTIATDIAPMRTGLASSLKFRTTRTDIWESEIIDINITVEEDRTIFSSTSSSLSCTSAKCFVLEHHSNASTSRESPRYPNFNNDHRTFHDRDTSTSVPCSITFSLLFFSSLKPCSVSSARFRS